MSRYVLDTNILTALLRYEPKLVERIDHAAAAQAEFLLCPVVFYEILRGLFHRDAKNQLQLFLNYTAGFTRDDFNPTDWLQAAQRWAELRREGRSVEDADLFIAVYAAQRRAVVVTDNEKDFAPLGVTIENWRR